MNTYRQKQTEAYFKASSALSAARTQKQRAEALSELLTLWLHTRSDSIQASCRGLLVKNGWQEQMDDLCRSWAL